MGTKTVGALKSSGFCGRSRFDNMSRHVSADTWTNKIKLDLRLLFITPFIEEFRLIAENDVKSLPSSFQAFNLHPKKISEIIINE